MAHELRRAEWPYKESPAQRGAWSFGITSKQCTVSASCGRSMAVIRVPRFVTAHLARTGHVLLEMSNHRASLRRYVSEIAAQGILNFWPLN